jgi:endonuclease/exonuclease/phosphatase family metal-dependent hydrolase
MAKTMQDDVKDRAASRLIHPLPFTPSEQQPRELPGDAHLPRPCPTRTFQGFHGLPEARGERQLGNGDTLLVHHPNPRPPRGPELTVMTFNILLGGLRRDPLLAYLELLEETGRMPDVIGVQEANLPMLVLLARKHGFHLAYHGEDGMPLINGKAYLSRYPIREAVHYTYAVSDEERAAAIARHGQPGELIEDRGALVAVIDVRGRPVTLFNVHHALGDPGINLLNLHQLHALVRERGGSAVVMGDFNANVAIKREGTRVMATLRRGDQTHTVQEFEARYGEVIASVGDIGIGNIGDPRVRHALCALSNELPEAVCDGDEVRVRRTDGTMMAPKEARKLLSGGTVERNTEEWRRLRDVADATTLNSLPDPAGVKPATGKRFDTIFATRDLHPVYVEVDHSTEASDHQPLTAHFRLD